MQTKIKFRTAVIVVAIIGTIVVSTSCTSTKKYGCPNHLFTPAFLR